MISTLRQTKTHASHIRQSSLSRSRAPSRDRPTPPPTSDVARVSPRHSIQHTALRSRENVQEASKDGVDGARRSRVSRRARPRVARARAAVRSRIFPSRVPSRHRRRSRRIARARAAIVRRASPKRPSRAVRARCDRRRGVASRRASHLSCCQTPTHEYVVPKSMPMAGPSALLMFLARKVVPTPRLRAGAPARRGDATATRRRAASESLYRYTCESTHCGCD